MRALAMAAALAAQMILAGGGAALAQEKPAEAPAETIPDHEAIEFVGKLGEALPKKGADPEKLFGEYSRLFKGGKPGAKGSAMIEEYGAGPKAGGIRDGLIQFKSATAKARKGDSFLIDIGMAMGAKEVATVLTRIVDLERGEKGIQIVRERKQEKGSEAGFKPIGAAAKSAPAGAVERPAGPLERWEFPADKALGKLQYYDFNSNGWKEVGEAKGEVSIPKGVQVTLVVSQDGAADLTPLAKLPKESIHALLLEGVQFKGEQLASLKGMDSLKKLSLRDAKISDADLAILKELPTIEELDLAITPIGDEGVKLLKDLPKLQVLDISYTKATNASVDVLKEMTNLTYLDPQRTEIKGDKLDELIEALPNCSVVTR